MTIDEVIEMIRTNICNESNDITKSVWLSIAEWLEELKILKLERLLPTTNEIIASKVGYEKGYSKAIADFAERLCYKIKSEIDDCADELQWVDEIAEQLKAGESCENN